MTGDDQPTPEAPDQIDRATATLDRVVTKLESEQWWRGKFRVAGLALAVLAVAAIIFCVFAVHRFGDVLNRLNVSPAACAKERPPERTIGCDNYEELVAIQQATSPQAAAASQATIARVEATVVNTIDCKVRESEATVLHLALPTLRFTLPASAACPAFTPDG